MNIYIKIEVLARELEGRLLLALAAAERGHRVMLGDFRSLLSHRQWLPPGIFHDKSLTPSVSKRRLHQGLVDAGFLVTSQDEEHGLLQSDYAWMAESRYSEETLGTAARVFMWGPHDEHGLLARYPKHREKVVATGSPRVDLWRPTARTFYSELPRVFPAPDGPLVLIAAHGLGPLSENRFWDEIANLRGTYLRGEDDASEWQHYEVLSEQMRNLGRFVRVMRGVIDYFPSVQFILRPHPSTAMGAWERLLGHRANLAVRRDGPIGPWIRSATMVVHDSSTAGIEAAVAGVPLASFWPTSDPPPLLSARLGRHFETREELIDLVEEAVQGRGAWFSPEDTAFLDSRFQDLEGPLAADRIVAEWEQAGGSLEGSSRPSARVAQALAGGHRLAGSTRVALRKRGDRDTFATAHKFPGFSRDHVRTLLRAFQHGFDRFHTVRIRPVGRHMLVLESSRGRE